MTLPVRFQLPNGTIEATKTACAVPSDVGRGAPAPGSDVFLFVHRAGNTSNPATPADRPWIECLTRRLSATASSEEVRDYRASALGTLARL